MRKIILVIVAILAVAFVFFSITELENILDTLKKSDLVFLLVALVLEVICLFNSSATFGALYRLVGLRESHRRLFLISQAANFVNLIAPSAGVGGMAVFLDDANRRNIPQGKVLVVGVLYLVYEYAALFCVLLLGFIILLQRNNLHAGELIAAGFLLLVAFFDGLMLYLGSKSSEQLGKLLAWLSRLANRILKPFFHRNLLDEKNAHRFSREVAEGISTIRSSPKNLLWPFLYTLNNKVLLISILAFSFLALNVPFTASTLVGGFSISYLFFYASPTPSGVGFVEGILPVALNTLKVPFTQAVLITLLFRAVTLWFPLVVGGVAFRVLQKQPQAASEEI